MGNPPDQPADNRTVFTARDDAGNHFALVLHADGGIIILRNGVPFSEPCPPSALDPCIRTLLQAIRATPDAPAD
jgi:hypothetical protein